MAPGWCSIISPLLIQYKMVGMETTVKLFSLFQCLCVSPTYELALQNGKVIEQMGKYYPDVKLVYAIRGNKRKDVWPFKATAAVLFHIIPFSKTRLV